MVYCSGKMLLYYKYFASLATELVLTYLAQIGKVKKIVN